MKAIVLFSGGLDSILAAKLVADLGIEVVALNAVSPFCLRSQEMPSGSSHWVRQITEKLGLRLISINISAQTLEIVKNPRYGYGSNVNPCIDCRIILLKEAKEVMQQEKAAFIITGEVLGQRPMSQRSDNLRLIEKKAGLEGLVLRPLSAGVLEPSIPEKEGWVDRNKLCAISGRRRQEQFALAEKFGIKEYPNPSGGCLLTDPRFSLRMKDLMKHGELNFPDIALLKAGRHFRLRPNAKLAVGRNEKENQRLLDLAQEGDFLFIPSEIAGPTALGRGVFDDELIALSSRIVARYCDLDGRPSAEINYKLFSATVSKVLTALPLAGEELEKLRI